MTTGRLSLPLPSGQLALDGVAFNDIMSGAAPSAISLNEPLRDKAIAGVHWSTLSQLSRQGLGLISAAIVARLLAPADYGLMGMAVVVTAFASVYRDMGTSNAVVHRPELTGRLLSSIFWMNVAAGLLIGSAIALVAPVAARFFHEPRLALVLCALGPTFVVSNLSATHQALLQRGMRFKHLASIEIVAALASYTAVIWAAAEGFGVWSLVLQTYVNLAVCAVLFLITTGWRPQWVLSWKDLRSISHFSLNLVGFSTINFCARNTDNALIGRYLGAQDLGFYSLAYRLMGYPQLVVSGLTSRVLFPLLTRVRDDDRQLIRTYTKVAGFIAIITCPMYLGMMVLARLLIATVFSNRWEPVVLPLTILSLVGMNQSIATMTGNLYMARGRTDLMFRVGGACAVIYVIGIVVGLHWGFVGVAVGYAAADALATMVDYHFAFALVKAPAWAVVPWIWRPLSCAAIMAVAVYASGAALVSAFGAAPGLICAALVGVVVYLSVSSQMNRRQLAECLSLVRIPR